ncbi:hypothetical protein NQD34_011490 [Periophthalmus magnuspinnatus]|nr:hypothetical protein NQD34_011490 [Periophthalmus magnuspinnatus]
MDVANLLAAVFQTGSDHGLCFLLHRLQPCPNATAAFEGQLRHLQSNKACSISCTRPTRPTNVPCVSMEIGRERRIHPSRLHDLLCPIMHHASLLLREKMESTAAIENTFKSKCWFASPRRVLHKTVKI